MDDQQNQDDATFTYTGGGEDSYDGTDVAERQAGVPLPGLPDITWSASEYLAHAKSASWYGMLAVAGVVISGLIYLVTTDLFATIAVALAIIILGSYAGRPPATRQYHLSEDGIKIDQAMYGFDTFRSFSVVEEGGVDSVWLKPLKRFSPMVVMYFSPDQENEIVNMLSNFLPHEQRELDGIDRLSRRMRF